MYIILKFYFKYLIQIIYIAILNCYLQQYILQILRNRINISDITFIFLCRQENETKETPDLNFIHASFVIILH